MVAICCGPVPAARRGPWATPAFPLPTLIIRRGCRSPCRLHCRSARVGCGYGLIILLQRNLLFIDKLFVAHQIVLRLHVVGFRLCQLRFGGGKLLTSSSDSRGRVVHIGLCAGGLGGGGRGSDLEI